MERREDMHDHHQIEASQFEGYDVDGGRCSFWRTARIDDPRVCDHVIDGMAIVPAAATLEMVRLAAERAAGGASVALEGVVWSRPIGVDGEVVLRGRLDLPGAFSVSLGDGNDASSKCVQGNVRLEPRSLTCEGHPDVLEPAELLVRARARPVREGAELYSLFEARGYRYGATYRTLKQLSLLERGGLARLCVDSGEAANRTGVDPSLIDGAFQAAILSDDEEGRALLVPFELGALDVRGPLQGACWALITPVSAREGSPIRRFDVSLYDDGGELRVRMRGLALKEIRRAVEPRFEVLDFEERWIASAGTTGTRPVGARGEDDGVTLAFVRDVRVAEHYARMAGREGAVVAVVAGATFSERGPCAFAIAPESPDDCTRLFDVLAGRGLRVSRVVHAWLLAEHEPSGDAAGDVELGLGVLFRVVKQLALRKMSRPVELLFAYRDAPAGRPACACVGGFLRSASLENGKLRGCTLAWRDDGTLSFDRAAEVLHEEAMREKRAGVEVKIERGLRSVARFVGLPATGAHASLPVREGGVYLITGGAGALGLIVAAWLTARARVQVILTGRSPASDELRGRMEAIARGGSNVRYLEADVASPGAAAALCARIRADHGALNGVIHAAGVLRDRLIVGADWADFRAVLGPKVEGTASLDEATRSEPLDFFVMFASTSGVLGNVGQGAYAAANRYLDHYAVRREALRAEGRRRGKTLSIAWPLWRHGGMGVDARTARYLLKTFGMKPLETPHGLEAFARALEGDVCRRVVVEGERERVWRALDAVELSVECPKEEKLEERDMIDMNGDGVSDGLERFQKDLVRMAEEIIGCQEGDIDLDGDISDYGFDSFSFTDLTNVLNERFELTLTPSVFFEHATLKSLSESIWSEVPARLHGVGAVTPVAAPVAAMPVAAPVAPVLPTAAPAPRVVAPPEPVTVEAPRPAVRAIRRHEPVAVVGFAAVLPGSKDADAFWKNLDEGRDLISEIPPSRWRWQDYAGDAADGRVAMKWGGFVDGVDEFDAPFFKISAREAAVIDPQQRLMLQTVWKAIEHAGYDAGAFAGTRTAVYMASAFNDYDELVRARHGRIEAHMGTGIANSILSNRISYHFNLRGPSESIDTACSGSLVAIHRGVESLRSGACEAAIVGGANVLLSPFVYEAFGKAGMLGAGGRCRTFDHRADGYVRAEGVVALVLKPLSLAKRDGDTIHGLILGAAVNHGGHVNTLTTPNPNAQVEVIASACEDAGVEPSTIGYVEAHGTGTPLGDPIEVTALKRVYGAPAEGAAIPCTIGSVKTHVGHLEAAAGVAGVLKVLLAMKHEKLPGNLHFEKLNPYISLEGTRLAIADGARAWPKTVAARGELPRRAGISSFGFGGTNAHVVVQEPEPEIETEPARVEPRLFVLSAENAERLREYASRHAERVEELCAREAPERHAAVFRDLTYTMQVGRRAMPERLAIVASRLDELGEKLRAHLAADGHVEARSIHRGRADDARETGLARVFGGESGLEMTRLLVQRRELDKLAQLWAFGVDVDFHALAEKECARRIPLPTYPFARERHWVDDADPARLSTRTEAPAKARELRVPPATALPPCFVPRWTRSVRELRVAEGVSASPAVVWIAAPERAGSVPGLLSARHGGDRITWLHGDEAMRAEALQKPDVVYFVAGSNDAAHVSTDGVEQGLERGIVALFHLVKAIARFQGRGRTRLVVITRSAHDVLGDAGSVDPHAASVAAFAKGLPKDLPELDVLAIDLGEPGGRSARADERALLDVIAAAAPRRSEELAIRDGARYVRTLRPVTLEGAARASFVRGGTYVIVGGMGSVGSKAAAYLTRTVGANVVLIGRSPLDAERAAKVESLGRPGARAVYLRADVCDAESMKGAFVRARAELGAIDGVLMSAMEYDETRVSELDEVRLREVLAPKVAGTVALARALEESGQSREAEPGFVYVFSSAQVFTANAGRCHYAAACAFQDALAQRINARMPYAVKVIDWGFWRDERGEAASRAEHREEVLGQQGISVLECDEGMAVLEHLSAHAVGRLAVFKVRDDVAELMGVDRHTPLVSRAGGHGALLARTGDLGAEAGAPSAADAETGRAFERLAALHVLRMLHAQRVLVRAGECHDISGLRDRLGVLPKYARLFTALVELLARASLVSLSATGDGLEVRAGALVEDPNTRTALGTLDALRDQLVRAQPGVRPFVALFDACVQRFAEILRGEVAATEVLFAGGSLAEVEAIYGNNPIAARDNERVAACVRNYIEARLRAMPQGAKLRILEIGAGTGATTAAVLPAIAAFGDRLAYVYTDVSQAFLGLGRSKFAEAFPFTTYERLDIEAAGDEGGAPEARYDLVIASNVLHATRDLRRTLAAVKARLVPGGWLVLNEATEVQSFTTMTFGLLDGWWRFEDADERLAGSPLASPVRWRRLLAELGFASRTSARPADEGRSAILTQSLVVAESDGIVHEPIVRTAAAPGRVANGTNGHSNGTHDVTDGTEAWIRTILGKVLRADHAVLDARASFHRLGLDSILALELARELTRQFGVAVSSSAVLEHASIHELAAHVASLQGNAHRAKPAEDRESARAFHELLLKQLENGHLTPEEAMHRFASRGGN